MSAENESGDVGFDLANLLKKAIESAPGSVMCALYKPLMRVHALREEVSASSAAALPSAALAPGSRTAAAARPRPRPARPSGGRRSPPPSCLYHAAGAD